jgi:23S rRNA pseudoU1915 N3-methylase RlmH
MAHQQKPLELSEALTIANQMWNVVRARYMYPSWKTLDDDEKMSNIRSEGFGRFIDEYVIVSKQMILNTEYHPLALSKYIKWKKDNGPFRGAAGWAYGKSYYIKFLFKAINANRFPNKSKLKREAEKERVKIEAKLKEEYLEFDELKKEASSPEKIAEYKQKLADKKRNDLIKLIGSGDLKTIQLLNKYKKEKGN